MVIWKNFSAALRCSPSDWVLDFCQAPITHTNPSSATATSERSFASTFPVPPAASTGHGGEARPDGPNPLLSKNQAGSTGRQAPESRPNPCSLNSQAWRGNAGPRLPHIKSPFSRVSLLSLPSVLGVG